MRVVVFEFAQRLVCPLSCRGRVREGERAQRVLYLGWQHHHARQDAIIMQAFLLFQRINLVYHKITLVYFENQFGLFRTTS